MRDIVPLKQGCVNGIFGAVLVIEDKTYLALSHIFGAYPKRVVKSCRRVCLNRLSQDATLGFSVACGLIAMTVAIG